MRAEIWMGGKERPAYIYEVKKVERSIDGMFIKITSALGDVIEAPSGSIVLFHDKEKGGVVNG